MSEGTEETVQQTDNPPIVDTSLPPSTGEDLINSGPPKELADTEPAPLAVAAMICVYKKVNDGMMFFCGEPVKTDESGKEYFELADYMQPIVNQNINLVWPPESTTESIDLSLHDNLK